MLEIESSKLYTIIDGQFIKIEEHLLVKFNQVLQKINAELDVDKSSIKILYRGDKLSKVKSKLATTELKTTLEKIFILGEKANSLFITSNRNNQNLFRIDNVENEVFDLIFTKINMLLNAENKSRKLLHFIEKNEEFVLYFSDLNNKNNFIKNLQNSNKRLFLKDYYLAFLHTVGNIIENESYFLSTSEQLSIAERFASNNNEINNRLIFCYYINKPFISYGIYSKNKGFLNKEIQASQLVSYSPLHEKEEEFSIRGGFLPHYILYIRFYENGKEKFLINPFIFIEDYSIDTDLSDGFPVDQENFVKELQNTNYKGHFTHIDNRTIQYP